MPATHVLVRHDDGLWYVATLLDQHRSRGRWRAVVRYTVAPGFTFQRGLWADELRPRRSGLGALGAVPAGTKAEYQA